MLFPMIWRKNDGNGDADEYGSDPFGAIDKMMTDFWNSSFESNLPKGFSGLKADVIEKDGNYELIADLPGFNKEDIHIDVKDNVLTISAEHEDRKDEEKDGRYIRRERGRSSFRRSFRVDNLKHEDIKASYKNGVLTVTVPKKDAQHEKDVKRIAVTD